MNKFTLGDKLTDKDGKQWQVIETVTHSYVQGTIVTTVTIHETDTTDVTRAEVARLREALENIANNMPDEPADAYPGDITTAEWKLIVTGRIVRAALKG